MGKKLFKDSSTFETSDSFELDILWEDILWASGDGDGNVISRSMRRNGLLGKVSPCLIVLKDGGTYVPEKLSLHWEVYMESPKIKPSNIVYIRLK